MSDVRTRSTWGAGRSASAPPATPGYGKEDQGHPAHKADPAQEAYSKGDPSAWAEDPAKPPYKEGNPPALPGYDAEDKDHPAHQAPPRNPKNAADLRARIERKASRCIKIARGQLGPKATQAAVEDHALDLMDLPEGNIASMLKRMGAEDDPPPWEKKDDEKETAGKKADAWDEMGPDPFMDDPDMPMDDMPMDMPVDYDAGMPSMMQPLFARLRRMEAMIAGLKQAGEVPPQFQENVDKKKEEAKDKEDDKESAKKSAKKAEDEVKPEDEEAKPEDEDKAGAKKKARALFASYDRDGDGFITLADWANPVLFTAMDTDKDGILATEDFVAGMTGTKKAEDLDEDEIEMLQAAMADKKQNACGEMSSTKKAEAEDKPEAEAKPEDEDKPEEEVAGKKAADDEEPGDEDEGEPDDEAKMAAEFFATGTDPMGLSGEQVKLSAEDEATLASVFGEEGTSVTALSLPGDRTPLSPKPKKASTTPKTLGAMTRTASTGGVSDLADLWDSSPDVSEAFGMKTTY